MTARRYRKRPVEVEAVQWLEVNEAELVEFTNRGFHKLDESYRQYSDDPECTADLYIATNSAWVSIKTGAWVLKDSAGCYPCLLEVFDASYDPAEDRPSWSVDWALAEYDQSRASLDGAAEYLGVSPIVLEQLLAARSAQRIRGGVS